jgi:hypothetical protein
MKQIPPLRCGMTARKARAKAEADPCGMTARKARANAKQERARWLLLEQWAEEGFYVQGYLLVALGGGVGGVFLHVARDVVDVFEEEG